MSALTSITNDSLCIIYGLLDQSSRRSSEFAVPLYRTIRPYKKEEVDLGIQAIKDGHLEIFKWVLGNHKTLGPEHAKEAAKAGRRDILEFILLEELEIHPKKSQTSQALLEEISFIADRMGVLLGKALPPYP